MVWFYGDGSQFDSTNPLYNGDLLAREGIILVSFNYRLGVFGYQSLITRDTHLVISGPKICPPH